MIDTLILPPPLEVDDLAVVSWRHPDGSLATGAPLPRPQAEALARAYARLFPRQQYWTQTLPWLTSRAPRGRA